MSFLLTSSPPPPPPPPPPTPPDRECEECDANEMWPRR